MSDDPTAGPGAERTRSTAPVRDASTSVPAHIPARIGRYAILRVLGEGGMGTVYEAEQEQPKRVVALKVIRAGYLSPQLLRRFEHESHVLGRLQHPGIAQVYEAGTVQDERGHSVPFFAMEFIRGVPLTEYAAQKTLGTRERLDLVARICDAVYHAHQKGVIHRDLKPSNILVDESGQPKILDFGVARATDSDIQQTTVQTDIGQLIGTVPYMSPEQVSGDPDALDTRSDVYALGVIAYELLAGRLPYDLQRKMIHEAVRVIREEEPTRLSSIDKGLRGDVETIVAKALEKDKARRYQSAESFASDIRRYLKDEPIAARPATTWYQVRKFSARNKVLVGGVAMTLLALAAGLVGTGAALGRARRAEVAEKQRADELDKVAAFQEAHLQGIDARLMGTRLRATLLMESRAGLDRAKVSEDSAALELDGLDKALSRTNLTNVSLVVLRENVFDRALLAVNEQFKDQPLVRARLLQTLATTLRHIGLVDQARPPQTEALAIRRRMLGNDHPDTLVSVGATAHVLEGLGRSSEAEPYFREALDTSRRTRGDDDPDTLASLGNLGYLLLNQGRVAEAEPLVLEAAAGLRRVVGDRNRQTISSISYVAELRREQSRLSEAESFLREAVGLARTALGEEDSETLGLIKSLASLIETRGGLSEAEGFYRQMLEGTRRGGGDDHPLTLIALHDLGSVLIAQGKLAEAEQCLRETLERSRRVLGSDHPETLNILNTMGFLLRDQGRADEIEPFFRQALEGRRRVLGNDHPDTLGSILNMGNLLAAQGRTAEAEPFFLDALDGFQRVLGSDHLDTLTAAGGMAGLLRQVGRLAEAEPLFREVIAGFGRIMGENSGPVGAMRAQLGKVLAGLDRHAEAETDLVGAERILANAEDAPVGARRLCVRALVGLYESWDKSEPGKGYDAKAAEWKAKLEALDKPADRPTPGGK